jgi:hypothetical protein
MLAGGYLWWDMVERILDWVLGKSWSSVYFSQIRKVLLVQLVPKVLLTTNKTELE